MLIDTASHSLDLLQFPTGPLDADSATGLVSCSVPDRGDDTAAAMVRLEGGAVGVVGVGARYPFWQGQVEVVGEKGIARFDYSRPTELSFCIRGKDWTVETVEHVQQRFVNQVRAFAELMDGGQTDLAGFDAALAVARAVDRIYRQNGVPWLRNG